MGEDVAASKRLTLRGLGEFHYKWGKLWAYCKSRTLARMITDTFENRIEENMEQIRMMLHDIADQRGITVDQLIDQILNTEDGEEK